MKQELKISEYTHKVRCTVQTIWNRIKELNHNV